MKSIFETTCGRCGTHWLKAMLSDILGLEIEIPEVYRFKSSRERASEYPKIIRDKESDNPGGNIYTFHVPLHNLSVIKDITNIIVLVRDLRDVSVSGTFFQIKSGEITENQFYERLKKLLGSGGANPEFVTSYQDNYEDIPHVLVRYEDLVLDTAGTILRILSSFGYPYSMRKVRSVLQKYTFEYLSKGRKVGDEDVGHHYRKGVIGDWKNYLSREDNEQFLSKFGAIMRSWGYNV